MKEVMKRITCLTLCGVLTLGSLPLGVLAQETQPQQTQSQTEEKKDEPKQEIQELTASDDAENEQVPSGILVNGVALESAGVNNLSYDEAAKTLNLNGVSITNEGTGIKLPAQVKTICLTGNNYINTKGIALEAAADLTILGDGALMLSGASAEVVKVAGVVENEKEKGLTIDGNAQVKVESSFQQTQVNAPVAIDAPRGVTIGAGAHLVTSHTRVNQRYAFANGGYQKKDGDGFVQTSAAVTADGSGMAFIGANHYDADWHYDADQHYKTTCKKIGEKDCPLTVESLHQNHNNDEGQAGTCTQQAVCKDCGQLFGETDPDAHTSAETKYILVENDTKHLLVHSCCEQPVAEAQAKEHTLKHEAHTNVTEKKAYIAESCEVCEYEVNKVILSDPEAVYDGSEKKAALEDKTGEGLSVTYVHNGEDLDGAPVDAGTYIAKVEWKGQTAELSYTIAGVPLADIMISQIPDVEYDGEPQEKPEFTVTHGTTTLNPGEHYTVEYLRDGSVTEDFTNAGEITVKITAVENSNYSGTASATWEITKKQIVQSYFKFELPEETAYDGNARTGKVELDNDFKNLLIGPFRLEFYRSSAKEEPVAAGTYSVKIVADGNENYEGGTFDVPGTFRILTTNNYTVVDQQNQKILQGTGDFEEPKAKFGLIDVPGKFTYYKVDGENQTEKALSVLKNEIAALEDGQSMTIAYKFTPTAGGNFEGDKPGRFTVTAVAVTFEVDGKAVSEENPAFTVAEDPKAGNRIAAISTGLKAVAGDDETGEGFFVKYVKDGSAEKLDVPKSGKHTISLYFTGEIGGVSCTDRQVASAKVEVGKNTPEIETAPTAKVLPYTGAQQELITAGTIKVPTAEGEAKLQYKVNGGAWTDTIPKAAATGIYEIYYKIECSEDSDYSDKEFTEEANKRIAVIHPALNATFGDKLKDVAVGDDKWTWKYSETELDTLLVGDAGDNPFEMDYKNGDTTWTGKVTVHVEPKEITPVITLEDTYKSHTGNEVKNPPVVKVGDTTLVEDKDYILEYNNNKDPGVATVTVKPKEGGNYTFADRPENTKEYVIYNTKAETLTADVELSPELQAKEYDADKVKSELNAKVNKEDYPEANRKYYNFAMEDAQEKYSYDPLFWPDDGVAFQLSYPTGTDADTDFAAYAMNATTFTTEDGEVKAGEIKEIKVEKVTTTGGKRLKITLDNYSDIVLAWVDNAYTVGLKTVSNGVVEFFVGDDEDTLIAEGKSTSAKKGDKITVKAKSLTKNYYIANVEYYEKGTTYSSKTAEDAKRNEDGTFTFTMPAYDTYIKVSIAKIPNNPGTGDRSNIHFWSAGMLLSGAAAAMLLTWRKKRASC